MMLVDARTTIPPGWKERPRNQAKSQNYTFFTSPSGKVRVQDTHGFGRNRYQVVYKDGGSWLESHETGSLKDAFRVALKDEETLKKTAAYSYDRR